LILVVCLFPWVDGGSEKYPLLGQDSLKDVVIVEDHSEVLGHWVKKGIRNAILINIDTHDDIRRISSGKIDGLKKLYDQKDIKAISESDSLSDKGLYDIGNFIYAAGKLGMIKEVYWIIPFSHFSQSDIKNRVKKLLKSYRFSDDDINTFEIKEGCLRGEIDGIPLNICGIEALPQLNNPAILSIDMDFFPYLSVEYRVNKLEAIKMLFESLSKKDYKVMDAVVAYSVNGGYTTVLHRWLGDVILEVLKEPNFILNPVFPKLYTILQRADIYVKEIKPKETLQYLMPLLETYKDNSALLTYAADAYYLLNDIDKAFYYAEKSCVVDKNYCYILPYIGKYLVMEGRISEAERFFVRGYGLNPKMNYLQDDLAIALKKAGRYRDSLKYFEILKSMIGSFPAEFMIGEVYLLMGDERAAKAHFDRGRDSLRSTQYVVIDREEVAAALISAVQFYEKKGYIDDADEIRKNPKLKIIF
jgi:hypothetical protein